MGNKFHDLGYEMGKHLIAGPYELFNNIRKMLNAEARAEATAAFYMGAEAGFKERAGGK
jgi:hypothetical protein